MFKQRPFFIDIFVGKGSDFGPPPPLSKPCFACCRPRGAALFEAPDVPGLRKGLHLLHLPGPGLQASWAFLVWFFGGRSCWAFLFFWGVLWRVSLNQLSFFLIKNLWRASLDDQLSVFSIFFEAPKGWFLGRTRPAGLRRGANSNLGIPSGLRIAIFADYNLGVDSFSILFNHRSFQKPAVSPGFWVVRGFLERRILGKNGEGTPGYKDYLSNCPRLFVSLGLRNNILTDHSTFSWSRFARDPSCGPLWSETL